MSDVAKNRQERRGRGDRRGPFDPLGLARLGRARTTPASLYTHTARYCSPCPKHSPRSRLHRVAIAPVPPAAPAEAPPRPAPRVVTPMTFQRRLRAYMKQNGNRPLTDRQWKRLWDTEISGWDYARMSALAERFRGPAASYPRAEALLNLA